MSASFIMTKLSAPNALQTLRLSHSGSLLCFLGAVNLCSAEQLARLLTLR